MCFDAEVIEAWLRKERAEGLTLPVHLGVSGVVDKAKLMTMGVRIGLGRRSVISRRTGRPSPDADLDLV